MLKMPVRMVCSAGLLALLISSCPANTNAQAKPAATSAQSASSHVRTAPKARLKGKKQKEKEVVHLPPPPPPPPTPEQLPAQTPEVSYVGGLLTINAHNSTMNDVLAAVRRVTGATIEKPPMGGSERVVVHLGPGQPKDVLAALFNGSRYDYIILGPMGQPGGVQRVILTVRSAMPAQSPMANVPTGQPQPTQQEEPDNTSDTEDMTVPEQNQPEPEQPAQDQPQEQPQAQPANPEQQPQAQPQQNGEDQAQPHVKSPEELLRELQQMQQQQQQNQQNQPQSPQ